MLHRTLLSAALLAAPLLAQAAPSTLAIDPTHTYASYEISHLGLSLQNGVFTKVSGQIQLDEAARSGKVEVSIDADSLTSHLAKRDNHLKSADFFNVAKYPTLTFKSNKLQFKGEQLAAIDGELTLLGVTKPVTLTVTRYAKAMHPMMKKQAYGVNATTTIKRSDFGMVAYLPNIADQVKIDIALEAIKAD